MTARKPRRGDSVSLIIDEFSAVTDAAPLVIDQAERVRDVGGQVIVAAQSYEGLGNDEAERRRMVGALGAGVVLHRCIDPDELLKAAGTVRKVEQSWQVDDIAHSGLGSMRMAHGMRVDPDAVRQAGVGEAWVISNGRSLHMSVLPPRPDAELPDVGRALATAPTAGPAAERPAQPPPLSSFLEARRPHFRDVSEVAMSTQPSADAPQVQSRLWTVEETAAYLGVPVATMYRWRHHGSGPRAYRVGRYLRYDPAEVLTWLRSGSP